MIHLLKKTLIITFFIGCEQIAYSQMVKTGFTPDKEAINHKNIGLDKLQDKNYPEAIVEFSKYIELCNPEQKYAIIETYHLRAYCKSLLLDNRGAINDYKKIISLCEQWNFKPKELYVKAFFSKAVSEAILNMKEEACKDWSISGELGYSNAYDMIKIYCSD